MPDEPRRERVGRVLQQQLPHERLIGAEPLAHALEREGQCQPLQLRMRPAPGLQLLLEARQGGVAIFAQAVGIGLRRSCAARTSMRA